MRTIVLLSLLGLVVAIFVSTSAAAGIRCGTELINVGDTKLEVLRKCGEPDLREIIKTNGLIVEKWFYDCGAQEFIRILTFAGGALQVLETGDYGSAPNRCK